MTFAIARMNMIIHIARSRSGALRLGWALPGGRSNSPQSVGANRSIAAPPAVKPSRRAPEDATEGLDRMTGETKLDRLLTIGKFVVHRFGAVSFRCMPV